MTRLDSHDLMCELNCGEIQNSLSNFEMSREEENKYINITTQQVTGFE